MAKAKISGQDIVILAGATTFGSIAMGTVATYLLSRVGYSPNWGFIVASIWTMVHGPALATGAAQLKIAMGQRQPIRIESQKHIRSGRPIPFTSNGKSKTIFASVLPWVPGPVSFAADTGIVTFRVTDTSGIDHTILSSEMEQFVRSCWARQRVGNPPFSRTYWKRRLGLSTSQYNARMALLNDVPGVVIDRRQGRSGRMAMPPNAAMSVLIACHTT